MSALKLSIKSPAFDHNNNIPKKFTGEGEDVSPALKFNDIPQNAVELALICDDPDAPRPVPWVHWVLYGLPATTRELPENIKKDATLGAPKGAKQGKNDFGKIGYGGPMPPKGHGVHHYHFKLYALADPLTLAAGATKDELLKAMKGHILAEGELIGTYERK